MRVSNTPVTKKRRKKILKMAKGYFGSKSRIWKSAHEQVRHSGQYAYIGRKQNKRLFRRLWIKRINAACHLNNISYSDFIFQLKQHNILLNRKMLSEIAIHNPDSFTKLVEMVRAKDKA